ncbi:MAG: ABC transporter ATP-binding protein/permease [Clostridia bacterium]|nr:ABC transporter ATP-binding protein/permease [Clostridia bacterium]
MRKNYNYGNRFFEYLKNVKWLIGILLVFSLMLAGLSLVFPIIWANILVGLTNISSNTYMGFIKYVIIYIVLEFIEGIVNVIKNFVYTQMETKVTNDLKQDVFNKTLSLETKAFDKNKISYFSSKITEEPHNLMASFFKILTLIVTGLKVLTLLIVSYKLCFDVAVIFAVSCLIIYLTITRIKPFIAKNNRVLNYNVREYVDGVFNNIRNIREIKNLGCKKIISNEYKNKTDEIDKKVVSSKNIDNLMELLLFTIKFCMHSLVLIITTYYYFDAQTIEFSSIIILELYAAILYSSMTQIAEAKSIVMIYKNSLKSIFDILTNKNYASEKFGCINEVKTEGDLIVKNLSYALGNRKMILDDINFEIKKNSRVAFVDKGGSSKPILLKLLLRQYEPSEGRIMIDDINIKDLTEKALKKTIMLASENTFILDDTLENNIKIVKPNATIEEVVDVLKKTEILSWFGDITMGEILNTKLGFDGLQLNESRKQLISIARILLVSPKIVILEESHQDITSDDAFLIKNAIDKITDSTILIFSERISSISVCDEIVTLTPNKYGSIVTKDVIRERNLIGFLSKNKSKFEDDNRNEIIADIDVNADMDNIKKLNMQKGVGKNEEHRIFSQIW